MIVYFPCLHQNKSRQVCTFHWSGTWHKTYISQMQEECLLTLSQQQCYHLLMTFSSCFHQRGVALIIDLDTNRSNIR